MLKLFVSEEFLFGIILYMNVKNLQLAKNISWGLASVTMFFLILGNKQNNLLNAATFIFIVLGILFSFLQDNKAKK